MVLVWRRVVKDWGGWDGDNLHRSSESLDNYKYLALKSIGYVVNCPGSVACERERGGDARADLAAAPRSNCRRSRTIFDIPITNAAVVNGHSYIRTASSSSLQVYRHRATDEVSLSNPLMVVCSSVTPLAGMPIMAPFFRPLPPSVNAFDSSLLPSKLSHHTQLCGSRECKPLALEPAPWRRIEHKCRKPSMRNAGV